MTTSVAVVRTDMKHALILHAPPSPIPEEPAVKVGEAPRHAAALWDPWHELGLYDPVRDSMPCLGREPLKNGAPCRWEVDAEQSAGMTTALAKLAQVAPQDVNDLDLNRLLDLGLCGHHKGTQRDEAKSLGLKGIQYRLNIARMHHERMERLSDEIRKQRVYIQQLQLSMTSIAVPIGRGGGSVPSSTSSQQLQRQDEEQQRHQKQLQDQHQQQKLIFGLRDRISQLEHANVIARMETEKVEADAIDREAKLDRDIQERDTKIEDLEMEINELTSRHETERRSLLDKVRDTDMAGYARSDVVQEAHMNGNANIHAATPVHNEESESKIPTEKQVLSSQLQTQVEEGKGNEDSQSQWHDQPQVNHKQEQEREQGQVHVQVQPVPADHGTKTKRWKSWPRKLRNCLKRMKKSDPDA